MVEDHEKAPEYLKKIQDSGPVDNSDNFTIEDDGWTGSSYDLDTDVLLNEEGQDPHVLLYI